MLSVAGAAEAPALARYLGWGSRAGMGLPRPALAKTGSPVRRLRIKAATSQTTPAIRSICKAKPKTLANAPTPKMLASPAAIRPPNRRPRRPPKREARPPVEGAVAGVLAAPGLVIDLSMGAAVLGAVLVAGGAVYVRVPRLPKLLPRPTRAEAKSAPRRASRAKTANVIPRRGMKSLSSI